jgi:hypothetical protein
VREYVPHSGQDYGHVVALQTYVLHNWCAYGPTVACGGPVPQPGMKGKRLLWNDLFMFQACELGLQGLKFDSESSVSRGNLDCLFLLPHRVRTVTVDGIILMNANLYLACLV